MRSFVIPRPVVQDPVAHLAGPLPAVCVASLEEIPDALSTLDFPLSKPTLLVLGTLSEQSEAQREVCFRYCAEVIAPLVQRHYLAVITDGSSNGLSGLLSDLRETSTFNLLGIKRAEEGDELGENVGDYGQV